MFRYVQLVPYVCFFFPPSPEEVTAQLLSFWRPPLPLYTLNRDRRGVGYESLNFHFYFEIQVRFFGFSGFH
jgi:hypothetical protein